MKYDLSSEPLTISLAGADQNLWSAAENTIWSIYFLSTHRISDHLFRNKKHPSTLLDFSDLSDCKPQNKGIQQSAIFLYLIL